LRIFTGSARAAPAVTRTAAVITNNDLSKRMFSSRASDDASLRMRRLSEIAPPLTSRIAAIDARTACGKLLTPLATCAITGRKMFRFNP
jgi:hypothetical protein